MIKTQGVMPAFCCGLFSLLMAGCGGGMSLPKNPFASENITDRTFIGAAQTWDLDKNSVVTCDEWKQYASSLLREADGNGDSALAPDEWQAMARVDRLFDVADFKYFDGNADGKVSSEELTGKPNLAFKLLDKNGDCQIARDESVQVLSTEKSKDLGTAPRQDQAAPRPGEVRR